MKRASPLLIGLVLAVATCVLVINLPSQYALELLAAILVAAASVYVGSGLAAGSRQIIAMETVFGIAVIGAALLGLWYSTVFLALGFLAHAVWDFLHHPHRIGAGAGTWFPPFCMVYDIIVGIFIVTIIL